jgi:hypothetical protein
VRIPIKATAREPIQQAGYISATSATHAQLYCETQPVHTYAERSRRVQCASGLPPRADIAWHVGQVPEEPEGDMPASPAQVLKADMPGANDPRAIEGCLPLRNRAWGSLAGAQTRGIRATAAIEKYLGQKNLRLQEGRCVLLDVRRALKTTKHRSAAKRRDGPREDLGPFMICLSPTRRSIGRWRRS